MSCSCSIILSWNNLYARMITEAFCGCQEIDSTELADEHPEQPLLILLFFCVRRER